MQQRILVIGSGFAGMWSALGAARLLDQHGRGDVEVALIAPEPLLHLRPRLHEAAPAGMTTPLLPLFEAAGVRFIQGSVERIHAAERSVEAVNAAGERFSLDYDRLVLTTGSRLFRPAIPGLAEHAFSIDQTDEASALDVHLARLADLPPSDARNTVVVAGGGFTGIEIACEMPERVRKVLGADADVRVVIVERAHAIGPDLGPGPRPVIEQALDELGVVRFLGAAVNAIDADGLSTTTGERIEAKTVIWTAGMRASPLTEQVPGERDPLGRLHVSRDLRVKGSEAIFAAGDVALAQLDDAGNHALMSCQHAMNMGRSAGYNVAADLLGLATQDYTQAFYVTCLDLGAWGAVYTEGWDREVKLVGAEAKALKRQINGEWIYPPLPSRSAAREAADPQRVVVA
ncbi:NAD(P)/FAD-dependent oxidoreductase [Pseudomonas citronellolis]|uniref:NAD(P)/FAD-dependent oxidoreductase n=1 Tax=Pseudomonas citronellolis TaxID=53408 RepID=UPI0023E37AE3|nr:NAD(P)/FAD-dependent oxidoreductase [Pseudomonas citronellolis]MDF3934186.1 NAD(P)/FAD-dependent oxidoreductase [Pseudomonas citronellolis]